jgi:hypothetical protein
LARYKTGKVPVLPVYSKNLTIIELKGEIRVLVPFNVQEMGTSRTLPKFRLNDEGMQGSVAGRRVPATL